MIPFCKPILLPLTAAMALAGCAATPPVDEPAPPVASVGGTCTQDAGQGLIGQTASSETGAQALTLTGARTLRWGGPKTAFTMDYREDRVNVIYDAEMTITAVRCG